MLISLSLVALSPLIPFLNLKLLNVNGQLGRITFGTQSSDRKKCVIISTLLGAMRQAEDSNCNQ